jgi:hypothetical protein
MKFHSIFRTLSIVCYLFIFLQGMIITMPFILVLTLGIADAVPIMKILLTLADLALIGLAILNFRRKTKATIALECIVFFLLLSPLLRTLTAFPLQMFDYPLFIVPFAGFVTLYPLSLLFTYLDYQQMPQPIQYR